jgi:hypothetical protein
MVERRTNWHGVFVPVVTPFTKDHQFDEGACRKLLDLLIADGVLFREPAPALYLYRQRMGDHVQTGVVAGAGGDVLHEDLLGDVVEHRDAILLVEGDDAVVVKARGRAPTTGLRPTSP